MNLPSVRFHREWLTVLLSLGLQVPLAIFLGHYYDERVFMATGYVVSSGLNPYQPINLAGVFSNPYLSGTIPNIGYPPPWPLLLGLIYRLTFNIVANDFLYNFTIKVPIIISNVVLSYILRKLILKLTGNRSKAKYAWIFILFNPLIILTTVAWGEFDSLIALLLISSLYCFSNGMMKKSAILFSLSIVLKPITLPLIGLPFVYSTHKNRKDKIVYALILFLILLLLGLMPFNLLGWMIPSSPTQITSFFKMAGGMTLFNVTEIFQKTATLPIALEFLGFIWIPALLLGYYRIYRNPPNTMKKLVESAVILLFIFFLTRSWLSEQNVNIVLPLLLILYSYEKISFRILHLTWIIPFIFLFFNFAFPQLFFLVYPSVIPAMNALDLQIGTARLFARFVVTVVWYVLALRILSVLISKNDKN